MIYTIANKITKQDKNGNDYIRADLQSPTGEVFKNVGAFRGEFIGNTFDGELEKKGDFWNLKPKVTYTDNIPPKGQNFVAKAQERKMEGIEHSQDRKEAGIALSGSITNATNLVTSMMEAGILSVEELADIKGTIRNYIVWFKNIYENPHNIVPSSN